MSASPAEELAKRYVAALIDYIAGGGEGALLHGYEIGRDAIRSGMSILDVVALGNHALIVFIQRSESVEEALRISKAAMEFQTEVLSPLEMLMPAGAERTR